MNWLKKLHNNWMAFRLDRRHAWLRVAEELPQEERIQQLRRKLQTVERQILKTTGEDPLRLRWAESSKSVARVSDLMSDRCYLLNQMFAATPEEVERLEIVNARLYDLTKKMYAQSAALYRQLLITPQDESFTDDVEIEGVLRFSYDGRESILELENDSYYGSSFNLMFAIAAELYVSKYSVDPFVIEEIVSYGRSLDVSDRSDMTDEELGFKDWADDGTTWAQGWLRHPALEHICICHAARNICLWKGYSIPELLRMNDFLCEVTVKHQHFAEQDGSRMCWWMHCSFAQFRDKLLAEAKHRPQELRLGQFLFNRTVLYFPDEVETLRGSDHDCFYDDAKIEDYLRMLYDCLRPRTD